MPLFHNPAVYVDYTVKLKERTPSHWFPTTESVSDNRILQNAIAVGVNGEYATDGVMYRQNGVYDTSNGVVLDGLRGYIEVPPACITSLSSDFSVLFTFRTAGARGVPLNLMEVKTGSDVFTVTKTASSVIRTSFNAGFIDGVVDESINSGNWNTVVVTVTPTNIVTYLNGEQYSQLTVANGGVGPTSITFGANATLVGYSDFSRIGISDIAFFERELQLSDVHYLYYLGTHVPTNLSVERTSTTVDIVNDNGTGATIPLVDSTYAGAMSPDMFQTLNSSLSSSTIFNGDVTGTYDNLQLNTISSAGTYGNSANVPVVTIDSKGRVVNISTAIIDGTETKVTAGSNVVVTGNGSIATPYVIDAFTSFVDTNVANTNLTFTGSRVHTLGVNDLTFNGTSGDINFNTVTGNVLIDSHSVSGHSQVFVSNTSLDLSSIPNSGAGGSYINIGASNLLLSNYSPDLSKISQINLQNGGIDLNLNPGQELNINGNSGTSGQVLTSQGNSNPPQWITPSVPNGSETKVNSGTNISVTGSGTIASPYVINNTYTANGSETKVNAGSNISVTGIGTTGSPYVINSTISPADGSETKINAGTNVTVTGTGTIASPYVINSTGGGGSPPDGSETKVTAGVNISVTGTGTTATPYVINNTYTANGSETKVNAGTLISVTGSGTIASPYVINSTVDGSETKVTGGTDITVTGFGTIASPYVINNTYAADGSETIVQSASSSVTVGGTGTSATPYTISVDGGTVLNAGVKITITGTGTLADPYIVSSTAATAGSPTSIGDIMTDATISLSGGNLVLTMTKKPILVTTDSYGNVTAVTLGSSTVTTSNVATTTPTC